MPEKITVQEALYNRSICVVILIPIIVKKLGLEA